MASIITNMFCKTGAGGGVDPSCGKEGGGGADAPKAAGSSSHKDRLDKQVAKASNVSVLRTPTGYKEFSKHGTVHYSHEGHITGFEPNKTSHEMRFGAKGKK